MDVGEPDRDNDHIRCHNCRFPFIPRNGNISLAATTSIRRCPFCYVSLANGNPDNSGTPPTPPRTSNDHGGRAYATTTTMINIMTPADLRFTFVRHDNEEEEEEELEHNYVQESSGTPASKSFINCLVPIKLPGTILKGLSTTSTSCAICTDEFKLEEKVYKLPPPCSHWFHCDCILPWLRGKNTRPLCRHEFPNTKENNQLPAVADQSRTTAVRIPMIRRSYRTTLRITRRTFV